MLAEKLVAGDHSAKERTGANLASIMLAGSADTNLTAEPPGARSSADTPSTHGNSPRLPLSGSVDIAESGTSFHLSQSDKLAKTLQECTD